MKGSLLLLRWHPHKLQGILEILPLQQIYHSEFFLKVPLKQVKMLKNNQGFQEGILHSENDYDINKLGMAAEQSGPQGQPCHAV